MLGQPCELYLIARGGGWHRQIGQVAEARPIDALGISLLRLALVKAIYQMQRRLPKSRFFGLGHGWWDAVGRLPRRWGAGLTAGV